MINKENKLVPKLRFPEFQSEWNSHLLGDVSKLITEKAGTKKYKLLSVTAGVGLVSQLEKFGREIAGESYKNYYIIRKGDFAYNKSSVKIHPEGQIALLENEEAGAVPNSIFTCFRVNTDIVVPGFLKYPFENNIHGNWLRNFIAIGARANGALNVDNKDLLALPISLPSITEQQKIATCLSSLDELIAAHTDKLDALKDHKKGLMQQLFPAEGETVPKLRFKEFEGDGEWVETILENVYDFKVTNSLSRDCLNYKNGEVKNIHYGDIHKKFNTLFDINKEDVPFINQDIPIEKIKNESYCIEGDIIIADASEDLNDIGKSIEIINLNNEKVVSGLHTLLARQRGGKIAVGFGGYLFKSDFIRRQIQKESQGTKVLGISVNRISNIIISYPKHLAEQQKIANFLSSIDDEIAAQVQKIEGLKEHKKGLMQGLFPSV